MSRSQGVQSETSRTYVRLASGSFGSRNGQPWSVGLAQANDRTKPSDLAAGTFGSLDRIEPRIVQRAIEAQLCPWCGAGPYKMLAAHTNKAHGVDRKELRRLAELPPYSSICDPAYSEICRIDDDEQQALKAANAIAIENKKAERLKMFASMGGTWAAIEAMAASEGKTRRAMSTILRQAGATVPDGRLGRWHK